MTRHSVRTVAPLGVSQGQIFSNEATSSCTSTGSLNSTTVPHHKTQRSIPANAQPAKELLRSSSISSSQSSGSSCPKLSTDAYVEARRKNNEAVKICRQRKRQEQARLAEKHSKLKHQCEQVGGRNTKLAQLLAEMESVLESEGPIAHQRALLAAAKEMLKSE